MRCCTGTRFRSATRWGFAEAGSWPSADATAGKIPSHPNMYEVPPNCEACGEPVGMWEEILIGRSCPNPLVGSGSQRTPRRPGWYGTSTAPPPARRMAGVDWAYAISGRQGTRRALVFARHGRLRIGGPGGRTDGKG